MNENILNIRNKGPRVREFINLNSGRPGKEKIGCDGIVIDAIILILGRLAETIKKEINEDNVTKILEKYCLDWKSQDLESLFYRDKEITEYFGLSEESNKNINIALSSYMRDIIQKSARKEWAVNDFISMPHLEFGLGLYHFDSSKYLNKNQYKNRKPILNFYKSVIKEVGNMFYQYINPSQIAKELPPNANSEQIKDALVTKIVESSEEKNRDEVRQNFENDPQFIQVLTEIAKLNANLNQLKESTNRIEEKVDTIVINAELKDRLGTEYEKIKEDWQALRSGSISKMEFFGRCAQKVGKMLVKSIISQTIPVSI